MNKESRQPYFRQFWQVLTRLFVFASTCLIPCAVWWLLSHYLPMVQTKIRVATTVMLGFFLLSLFSLLSNNKEILDAPMTTAQRIRIYVSKAWLVIIFAVVLSLFVFVIYRSGAWLHSVFSGIQKEVQAASIAASATVLVSVLSVVLGKAYERKRAIEQEIRNKKIPIYEKFIRASMEHLLNSTKDQEPENLNSSQREQVSESLQSETKTDSSHEKILLDELRDFTINAIIWGSDDVIKTWSSFKRSLGTQTPASFLLHFESLLKAIRKDTGHRSEKLGKGDLLSLFINDIDEYINK